MRFILLLFVLLMVSSHASASALDVRYEKLRRGVNIHLWVTADGENLMNLDAPTNRINADDAKKIKRMGFTHVRLSVSAQPLLVKGHFTGDNFYRPVARRFVGEIHRIIRLFKAEHIAVVLAVVVPKDVEPALCYDPKAGDEWAAFFWHWGKEFSIYSPDYFFFETINEPVSYQFIAHDRGITNDFSASADNAIYDANKHWFAMQSKFITALRVHAPNHTIMSTTDYRSSYYGLVLSKPLADKNIIYTFHYYDPIIFTHQDADWVAQPTANDPLNYPSYLSHCNKIRATAGHEQQHAFEEYCNANWDKQKHINQLGRIKDWAKQYHVKVWVGEFGVFPNKVESGSVYRYLDDVRTTFEDYHMGWCVWEYAGWLERLDAPKLQQALGLKHE